MAGTRSSAIPTWRSSRRPRPSPRTCRGRWGWPSRSIGPSGSGVAQRVAGRRRGRLLLRRRLGQPLHRRRGDQHRAQCRLPRSAGAAAVRLRGQRLGHLGPDAAGLDRGRVRIAAGPALRRGRRLGSGDRLAADHRGGRAGPRRPPARCSCTCGRSGSCGHAGSDAEISYRRPRDIEADYARDPLLGTAAALVAAGAAPGRDPAARYDAIGTAVAERGRAADRVPLGSARPPR